MAIPIQNIKKFLFYPLMCARVCRLWVAKFDGQRNSFNCILLIISCPKCNKKLSRTRKITNTSTTTL
ncbi:hypothetical protein Peur_029610 [Populus x canadensis]